MCLPGSAKKVMSRDINWSFIRELNTIVTYVITRAQEKKVRINKLAVNERIKIKSMGRPTFHSRPRLLRAKSPMLRKVKKLRERKLTGLTAQI